jgi:hypothetical protein
VFNVLFVGYSLAKDNLNNTYQYNMISKKFSKTIQYNHRNSFSRGFPLPFNVETLQAFGALFQIPQYYRKFLYYKTKMLCNYELLNYINKIQSVSFFVPVHFKLLIVSQLAIL